MVIWTNSALRDLRRLQAFIGIKSRLAAARAGEVIVKATNRLKWFPHSGVSFHGAPHYYDLPIKFGASGYGIRYKVLGDKVYIIHIKHNKELKYKSK